MRMSRQNQLEKVKLSLCEKFKIHCVKKNSLAWFDENHSNAKCDQLKFIWM